MINQIVSLVLGVCAVIIFIMSCIEYRQDKNKDALDYLGYFAGFGITLAIAVYLFNHALPLLK